MQNNFTRRSVLRGACGMAAYAALGGVHGWAASLRNAGINDDAQDKSPKQNQEPQQNAIAPAAALKRLMDGNARYARNQPEMKDYSAGRAARAEAQYPVAAILGCADSRVSPELIFDQGPGDLFVARVAGNYVNTDDLASLEYAVEVLNSPLVMVLGHSNCGAVSAVLKNAKQHEALPGHIYLLVDALRPGIESALKQGDKDALEHAVEANVRHNVGRLSRAQPILAQRLKNKKIEIVGAVYDLASGQVRLL